MQERPPHNLLAVVAIAPIASMESRLYARTDTFWNVIFTKRQTKYEVQWMTAAYSLVQVDTIQLQLRLLLDT